MAGPTVKEILLKWGVDTSSWKRAIQDISTLLEQQQSKAAKAQQDVLEQLEDQKAAVKDLIALQQDLTEELQRQAQIRSQTKTDDSGRQRVVHEKTTTDHIRRQVTAHKDVQDAAEESKKTAAEIAKQQKQIADEIKKQSVEIRAFITAQKAVQTELTSTLNQERLVTQEIKKQVTELQKLSTLRAPTAWKPTYVSATPAPVARGTAPTQAPAATWQSDMAKLQGGLATGVLKAGGEDTLKLNKQIREELEKRMAVLRQIPALTNAEVAEVNKLKAAYTQLNRAAHPPGKKEGNFFTEFASGFTSRFAGTLAFAVFSAEGLGRILETLTMKMKEFIESTGPLTQVREQFEKLATTQNVNPAKFIDDLRVATKGLVEDTTLYRTANQAMQSGMGTTTQDVVKLTQATVGLARAQGKDAKEALEAVDMFMTTGYARTLGRVTGIQSTMLTGVRSLGGGFDQSTRLALNFKEALELITRQYAAIGEPQITYTERLKQMEVAQHRFAEELALGIQKSAGFQAFLDFLGETVEKTNAWAEKAGGWGERIGAAFVGITEGARLLKDILSDVLGTVGDIAAAASEIGVAVAQFIGNFTAGTAQLTNWEQRLGTISGILFTLIDVAEVLFTVIKEAVDAIALGFATIGSGATAYASATGPVDFFKKWYQGIAEEGDKFSKREAERAQKLMDDVARRQEILNKLAGGSAKKYDIVFTAPDTRQTELQVMESEKRIAKVKEEVAIKTSQAILQTTEFRIKREQDLLQSQYEDGLITIQDFLSKKRTLEEEDYQAKLKQLRAEFEAKQQYTRIETETELFAAKLEKAKAERDFRERNLGLDEQVRKQTESLKGDVAKAVSPDTQVFHAGSENVRVGGADIKRAADTLSGKAKEKEEREKPHGLISGAEAKQYIQGGTLPVPGEIAKPAQPIAATATAPAGVQPPTLATVAPPKPAAAVAPAKVPTPQSFDALLASGDPAKIEQGLKAKAEYFKGVNKQIYDDEVKKANAAIEEVKEKRGLAAQDFRIASEKLAEAAYQKAIADFEQEKKDEQSAQKTLDAAAEKLVKDKINNEKLIVEDQFKTQEISAQEYLTKRVGFIEAEFKATESAENIKFEHGKKNDEARAARLSRIAEAEAQKERDLTKLSQEQWEIRTKAEEDNFANSQRLLDAQLSYQKQLTPVVGEAVSNQAQADTLREIINFKRQVLAIQEQEVQRLKDTNQEWFTQEGRVLKTKEEMLKYNEELIRAQAPLQGLSEIATNLSEGFGALRGKGMAGISQELGQFAQNISKIQKQAVDRNLRASQLGGGFWAQFGIGKPKTETAPISPADKEKMLSASLANADDAVKGAGSVAKALEDAISSTETGVKSLDEQVTTMASTIAEAIKVIQNALADTKAEADYSQKSQIQPGEGAGRPIPYSVLPRTPDSLTWFQGKPSAATGAMVVEGGVATIHAGEQISPAGEVMALVTAIKAAASELTRFTTNLDGLTKALGKLGESPWAGQPRGTAPPAGERAREASTSLARNLATGILGGPVKPTPFIREPDTRSWLEKLTGAQPFYSAQETGGAPVKKSFWEEAFAKPFKKPEPAVSTEGLSGPPSAATPLMSLTKSDSGDAAQTLMSMGSFGEGLDSAQQAQSAAIKQNIGVTQLSTQATSADTQALTQNTNNLGPNTSMLGGMSQALGSATAVVGGFQQALSGAGGPGKSALAGAQAGFQLGSMIPGPAGAVVGGVAAGVGAIVGIFAGKAREHTEKIAKQLEAAFQANTAEVQNGSQTLKGGIASAQALITTTVQELTGQKGGKQIMESVLPQMNQALDQLKQQQQQILTAFHDKLEVASSPIAYQDQLGQIQGIIQQYQQYIQAGGSVANANQFLQQSFQTLAQNGINQLNQSEQDAINNALSYNDLLLQRQDLIQNTNLQIQQIMSQGVAVRQAPQGVTKAAQIQQVVRQATEQQQNLDAEISTSKYKLDNEAKIFNLASTRVGLEQQLVNLQNQQTNLQLESTEALGNVVHQMQTALPTSMPAALAGLGLGAAYVPPEAAQAPIPPVKTGIKSVDIQAELEYQQELAYYQQQQNLPVGYINPAGSPAGTVTTGNAGNLYTGPTPGVPTTSPYPSSIGTTASQDQINQAIAIINAGKVGQPLNQPPNTTIPIGGGLGGPPSLGAADIIATPDGQAVLVTMASGGTALTDALTQNATTPTLRSAVRPVLPPTGGGGGGGTPTSPIPVGAPGSPPIPTPPIFRPQPQPGGGGPPAGPITFPTPIYPGGVVPEQQIPGQGGVPGTGITGVTVNPDGSLSFGQLPTSVLTPVDVGTGPGTTQDVGIIGTPPEVQAGITNTFSTLESVPIPTLVNPLPLPGTGGPPPPPPRPTGPPQIDTSSITAALDAAVAGDVQAEKVTMNQFIAILNNIDSVGIEGTIAALQAFHDNFAANHSGPQSRSSQRAMQVAINSLIQMALAQPAPVAPLSPITTVTGLPTQPTPSTPGLTPQQIMELNQRMDSTVLQTGPAIGPPPTLPPVAGTAEWLNGLTPQQQQAVPPIPSPTSAGSLTQPPDTVSTPLGQALVVTEGNAATASGAPTAANTGGTTFTVSQTPTSPMPTTPPPAGMFWAWAGSSWQPEPVEQNQIAPTLPGAGTPPQPPSGIGTPTGGIPPTTPIPPMPTTPLDNFQVWKWNGSAWAPAPSGYWEGPPPTPPTLPTSGGTGLKNPVGTPPVVTPAPISPTAPTLVAPAATSALVPLTPPSSASGDWAAITTAYNKIITQYNSGQITATDAYKQLVMVLVGTAMGTWGAIPSWFAVPVAAAIKQLKQLASGEVPTSSTGLGSPTLPTSPVIGPAPVVPPVGAPIHVGAAPVLGGGTAPTFQQSPANAPPPPANIGVYQTFTDDQGNVWAWQPRTMVDPIDGGIANGYWYLSSPGTPPTPVILPTPTPQPIAQSPTATAPIPPPAPANQAATQTFTDPQGNVWTWVPAHEQGGACEDGVCSELMMYVPGKWVLTSAITPTPPVIAPTPVTPPFGSPVPWTPPVTPIAPPTAPAKPNFGPQEANFYSTIGSFPVPQAGFQNLGLMLEYQIFLKLKKLMDGVVAGTIKPSDALVQVGQLKSSPIVGMLTNPSTLNAAFDQATAIFTAMMSVSTIGTGTGTGVGTSTGAPTGGVWGTPVIKLPTSPIIGPAPITAPVGTGGAWNLDILPPNTNPPTSPIIGPAPVVSPVGGPSQPVGTLTPIGGTVGKFFFDLAGNTWTLGSDATWKLVSAAPPGTPVRTATPPSSPFGPVYAGAGLIPSLGSVVSMAPSAASGFLSSAVRSILPPVTTATSSTASSGVAGTAIAELSTSTQRVTLEAQINALSSTRVAAETQLVSLKMQEIQADMARVAAHHELLATMKQGVSKGNTLEDYFNGLYQTRSRQGFGQFYGEISNAV